jgi:imidazoleglycerol-phosphate dehydratase
MDISARPYLVFKAEFERQYMGKMETAMVEEFFRALAFNAGITLHIRAVWANDHHKTEAIFKAFAHAFAQASAIVSDKLLSTKGVLS